LPEHPLKDSSVRTLLRRLEQQDYLGAPPGWKNLVYRAAAPTTTHAINTVRQLIEGFWSGSAEQFVAVMVDAKVLLAEELRQLAKKVKGLK
jgi:BlaI family transcriptional regulator, penicillinase repressor